MNLFFRAAALAALTAPSVVFAHGISEADKQAMLAGGYLQYAVLGAKHMLTGYDHLLFLFGVIFFLHRMKDVALYVTLFAVGHSITLLYGVLAGTHANPFLIDALIGLSVVYKGLDNLGAFERWLGFRPDPRAAVAAFGLAHGFGLATKLQEFRLSPDGLVANILAFNVGVEVGQLLALAVMVIAMDYLRASPRFQRNAYAANATLVCAGFVLAGHQLAGYSVLS